MIEIFYFDKKNNLKSLYHPDTDASTDKIRYLARKKDGREIDIITITTYGNRKYRKTYIDQKFPFVESFTYNPIEKTYVKN